MRMRLLHRASPGPGLRCQVFCGTVNEAYTPLCASCWARTLSTWTRSSGPEHLGIRLGWTILPWSTRKT
uniref:Uncharacterized protein n=1 Tax=Pararge aegeria TaxID=116150 RepID=S4P1P1_9NEOP